MLGVDVTVRHEGIVPEYIEFQIADTTMRDRFGVTPSMSFEDGLRRLARVSWRQMKQPIGRRQKAEARAEDERKAARVVVLGAGPAGMSAAWRLSELGTRSRCSSATMRSAAWRGRSRSASYSVDFGPHTFHIRETPESREILDAIKPFFGEDPLILTRGTRVLLRGKEYVYPLEMLQVLTGVSPLLSARIVFDYLVATMKSTLAPAKKEDSFEEWGVRNLGRTLYDLCFGIYSRPRVGPADLARFRRSRRSASPS